MLFALFVVITAATTGPLACNTYQVDNPTECKCDIAVLDVNPIGCMTGVWKKK